MDLNSLNRADWERILLACKAVGLPSARFRNGELIFDKPLTEAESVRVQEIFATRGADSQATTNQTLPPETVAPNVEPGPVQHKRGRGRPRKYFK